MEFLRAVFIREKNIIANNNVYIPPIIDNGSRSGLLSVKIPIVGIMY